MLTLGQAGRNQLLLDYYFLTVLMNETKFSSGVFNCFNTDLKRLACPQPPLFVLIIELRRLQPHTEKVKTPGLVRSH